MHVHLIGLVDEVEVIEPLGKLDIFVDLCQFSLLLNIFVVVSDHGAYFETVFGWGF